MPKMPNQKLKLIYLSKILTERTDRFHGLTLSEIAAALGEYGISAERKSLYDEIEALKLYGYRIAVTRDSHVRYHLENPPLDPAEFRISVFQCKIFLYFNIAKLNKLVSLRLCLLCSSLRLLILRLCASHQCQKKYTYDNGKRYEL